MSFILPLVLLSSGMVLEIYYYFSRFHADGTILPIALLIGVALNVFLVNVAGKSGWKYKALTIGLVIFSVISTSGGQTFALIEKQAQNVQDKNASQIERLEADNETYRNERQAILAQENATLTDLEKRFEYKRTIQGTTSRKDELTRLIGENETKIEMLKNEKASDKDDVYQFYANVVGNKISADVIKLFMHTLLSLFIALMAPVGIVLFYAEKAKLDCLKVIKETQETRLLTKEKWIDFVYRGVDIGKPYMPKEDVMKQYCDIADIEWNELSKKVYIECLKEATKNGFIDDHGKIIRTREDAEKILLKR